MARFLFVDANDSDSVVKNRGVLEAVSILRVSESLDDFLVVGDPLHHLGVLLHVLSQLGDNLDLLVVGLGLDLALGLKGLDDVLVLPSDLVGQTAKGAVLEKKENTC